MVSITENWVPARRSKLRGSHPNTCKLGQSENMLYIGFTGRGNDAAQLNIFGLMEA